MSDSNSTNRPNDGGPAFPQPASELGGGLLDARLIAAAPEMAELLERNQGIIMNALTSGHGLTPAIMADMREAFAAIRALLAKIKGETNA